MEPLYQLLASVAVLLLVGMMIGSARGASASWRFPGGLCAVFTGWSIYAVMVEGPFGFWPNHIQNAWGIQVWFDLLIAIGIGWTLLLPRARAVGMRPAPWLVLILLSGCVGLTAMLARCRYLEAHRP